LTSFPVLEKFYGKSFCKFLLKTRDLSNLAYLPFNILQELLSAKSLSSSRQSVNLGETISWKLKKKSLKKKIKVKFLLEKNVQSFI